MKSKLEERIRAMREEHGLGQTDLGRAVGVSGQVISNLETGRQKLTADLLGRIASYFNVSCDYLIGYTDNPSRIYLSFNDDDEKDLLIGFRKMDLANRRMLLGYMESILYERRDRDVGP